MRESRRHAAVEPTGQRILVVLPNWVGDAAWAMPALASIRRRFADSHITGLMRPYVQDVIGGSPFVDDVVFWQRRRPTSKAHRRQTMLRMSARLRRRKYDLAILLTNSFRAALVARLAGIKRIVGYDRDGRGLLLTDRLLAPRRNGKYLPIPMARYFNGVAGYLGCDHLDTNIRLFTTPDDESAVSARLADAGITDDRPLVVINPGASFGSAKCWYPDRFARVADTLIQDRHVNVVIVCGPGERDIARSIGRSMTHKPLICDDPVMPIAQLKALLRRSQLLITNDTGARPMGMAYGIPIVTIFGSTDPAWTEIGYPHERKVMIPVDCGPCMKRTCPFSHHKCMDGVTTQSVLEAIDALLAHAVSDQGSV